MPYIPHTEVDRQAMLAAIDMTDLGQLFSEIPPELQCDGLNNIPDGISEMVLQPFNHQAI